MNLFKRKKIDIFDYETKKKKKSGCKINLLTFFIIATILIISASYYIASFDEPIFNNKITQNSYNEINEDDLNLTWQVNKTNTENLKIKLAYVGLNEVAEEINPLTISSLNNSPTKDLYLNFDELGYLINSIFSFNSSFRLSQIVWTPKNNNIITINLTYSHDLKLFGDSLSRFYFDHVIEFNKETKTNQDISVKIINTSPPTTITDLTEFSEISTQIITFALQTDFSFNTLSADQDANQSNEKQSLYKMLGFSNLEILDYGIKFLI